MDNLNSIINQKQLEIDLPSNVDKNVIKSKIKYCNYFNEKGEPCPDNFPTPFLSIIKLFEEDCESKLSDCYIDKNILFITGYNKNRDDQCELMLRFNTNDSNNLVLARISFINQRKGKMTELYSILKQLQQRSNFNKIKIESVLTYKMKNWCLKNNFITDNISIYQSDYVEP